MGLLLERGWTTITTETMSTPEPQAISVSDLTQQIKNVLEGSFPILWVSGEISNFVHHGSGHMYFTLKDEKAEIRGIMFKGFNQFLHFKPENGMQVLLQGDITVYEMILYNPPPRHSGLIAGGYCEHTYRTFPV